MSLSSSYILSRKEGFAAVGSWWQIGGPVGGLGLVETLGVESRTGGFMVKAMEVAWSELVVRNGGGKAGIGGARWRWEGWNRWC